LQSAGGSEINYTSYCFIITQGNFYPISPLAAWKVLVQHSLQQPSCFGAKNELRRGGGGWLWRWCVHKVIKISLN
jgi:hypothetical protein